ncbi:unnamed protein product [Clonostachys rhizophaga]|uniref:Uncharacterized protein n=1 Tax=Clonostachys rhizophaga TaxID=160324 RepID=A0A9N9VIE4_9HYPO|nr:unnamed protein product [Clonostachys rhizophaga]
MSRADPYLQNPVATYNGKKQTLWTKLFAATWRMTWYQYVPSCASGDPEWNREANEDCFTCSASVLSFPRCDAAKDNA